MLTGSQAILTGLVFALAIRHGEGGLTAVDLSLFAFACAGLVGWVLAREPVVAVVDPHSETLAMYALASVAGALAAAAVGALDVSLLLYPAYYCVVNGAMALLIFVRRQHSPWSLHDALTAPGEHWLSVIDARGSR